jgi:hypothetical protein
MQYMSGEMKKEQQQKLWRKKNRIKENPIFLPLFSRFPSESEGKKTIRTTIARRIANDREGS